MNGRSDLLMYLADATPGDVQTFAKVCMMLEPAVIRTLQERGWQPDSITEFMSDCRARAEGKRPRRRKVKA